MRNLVSRLLRGFPDTPNIRPIHATQPKASDFVPSPTIYAYLSGLLLALIDMKYEALSNSPFKDHPVMMMLFLISKLVYVITLSTFPSDQTSGHNSLGLKVVVCHVFGIIACELLLLVLVSLIKCLIINLSSLLLLLAVFLSYKHLLKLFNNNSHVTAQGTETHHDDAEEQSDDTINVVTLRN